MRAIVNFVGVDKFTKQTELDHIPDVGQPIRVEAPSILALGVLNGVVVKRSFTDVGMTRMTAIIDVESA